ncbi:hypothetical protein A3F03_05105 [Candidatus Roizmanbacteria bacterium RIFCSPHIGHO2_12_FULL_41_11]|uniref:Glycosyltransferase RgtA/B/C/D-like domain-containing protein n=2 Tax=Candidatus Roizmaniibacteriota TaxID=1752723 RepID=A0A1F7JRF9_9BACT|nr:MAG: hypothetical protein A3F03_05105 [Candidatus Roizmanbacteria bacterium RIFCSPHIGHO2_12_FULL_41_11]OGK58210.1 MAG: hypothetical protein A3H86_02835 [Candidatus Roizmanbacteria bacterium RIFCSPLOWO2_02_FULL_41_9]
MDTSSSKRPSIIQLFSYLKYFVLILFLGFVFLFYLQKITFVTADLGRHLKNGELFFTKQLILRNNYYSYTEPQFKTITHHWGAGVGFYLIWKWLGFAGLSLFNALFCFLAFGFFFYISWKRTNLAYTIFFSLLALPLFTFRTEIRPETFSYFFLSVFYLILTLYSINKINRRWLWLLPIIQLFWVNTHIFFILGPALIGVYIVENLINNRKNVKKLSILFLIALFVCLINPFGLRGALEPLTIFKAYGYRLAENQPVFFMQKMFFNPAYYQYEILVILAAIGIIMSVIIRSIRNNLSDTALLFIFAFMAGKAVRMFPLFGFVFIPIVSNMYYIFSKEKLADFQTSINYFLGIFGTLIIVFGVIAGRQYYSPFSPMLGVGLVKGVENSAVFYQKYHLQGPIFNNYDIGGYLIFYLFPKSRVFVDNRPESYSVDFFQKTYIPMQENEQVWQKNLKKYQFNTIYFYRQDYTPWGQAFLISRVKDSDWAPVYVDDLTIIFLKRNFTNKQLIEKFELPKSIFKIS